jgi:hypothetical protein
MLYFAILSKIVWQIVWQILFLFRSQYKILWNNFQQQLLLNLTGEDRKMTVPFLSSFW